MSDALPDETRLAAEIGRLKAEFPKTRELYREVCALLFRGGKNHGPECDRRQSSPRVPNRTAHGRLSRK
jgi:hypothetical protein